MKTELTPFEYARDQMVPKPCWNVARLSINQTKARLILGLPHHVESDSFATAGGTEEHWTFLSYDRSPVLFRLRVPYQQLDICLDHGLITNSEMSWFDLLFGSIEIRYYREPWDENRHPVD